MSNTFVVIMGISTVFVGLIAIIAICSIMGALCSKLIKEQPIEKEVSLQSPVDVSNKQELIAACCAAVAEELGTDVSGIKVVSFKKVK